MMGHATIAGTYKGCPVHRIVRDGWIQSGDVVNGTGKGGVSIYGRTFADECFSAGAYTRSLSAQLELPIALCPK
jgi:cyclophilin family peptidyl-prolyl cis-trans isomerase